MKLLLLAGILLVVDIRLPSALHLQRAGEGAYVGQRGSQAVTLRHRARKTSNKTFILERNLSHSIASPAALSKSKSADAKGHDKDDADSMQPMISTPQGICMYSLPAHFNVGLLNSTFQQSVPQPLNISPSNDPPLQGMFDTIQFSLERIFYDRFLADAVDTRPAKDCVMFYVPYFVAWETSAVANTWVNAYRPALDAELFSHLTYYNASGMPGRNHFIVVGRISINVFHFLKHPTFENMVKLVLEDTAPGKYTNVFAIPYPTWFRYYPGLEPVYDPKHALRSTIKVQSAVVNVNRAVKGCSSGWLGNVTSRVHAACEGRTFCSYHILAELDLWVVGGLYEAMDANGEWWPVTIKAKNQDGTFSVNVHDAPGSQWPKVYDTHMRKHGQTASAAANAKVVKCPALEISGEYSCGGASYAFKSLPEQKAVGHAVVLGCPRGPCWLWGTCQHRSWVPALKSSARTGPLLAMIGSARPTEYERHKIFQMCEQRPLLCAVFNTGVRENSTSFVHSRIPDMYQMLMASTFCVNPPGDTPTRKGLFDSLILGCIPVVTSEDSLQHYKFHLPAWRSVSILVTTEQLFAAGFNLVDFLESYERDHSQEILQKQEAIRRHAYSLQYSFAPSATVRRGPDAFDKTLEHLLARPVSAPNQNDFHGLYYIVNVASGRRLYARSAGDYHTDFGASTKEGNYMAATYGESIPADQMWRIAGKGDGTCCYAVINSASNRALYAQVDATDWSKLGASTAYRADWADQRWRLQPKGSGTYTFVNVASGRRLFALNGHEENVGIGATLGSPENQDQRWKLEKVT